MNRSKQHDPQGEKQGFPGFQKPMLATLTKEFFDDPEWIFERKLDGIRCIILKENNAAKLYSRNQKLLNATYPELVECVPSLAAEDFIADGEIVAFRDKVTSFSALQKRMQVRDAVRAGKMTPRVFLYIFDLLFYGGIDLTGRPLIDRKRQLKKKLSWGDPVRYVNYRRQEGRKYHAESCSKGWEGIIAKNGKSIYVNRRSGDWLKFKCVNNQELVIGGFTEPQGQRVGFGALLVGFYKNGKLLYAGKVGTGFDDAFLKEWRQKFDRKRRKTSPFVNYRDTEQGSIHWISPEFVGQFEFTEWTDADKLRHPSFTGMRFDKAPTEVIKEA